MTVKFTKHNVPKLEDEIVEVLNKYGFKNITFSGNTRSFGETETTFKIVANINGTVAPGRDLLERHCQLDDIDINAVGPKGEVLVEYHPRKHTYPYIYKSRSGKRYKCNAFQAQRKFGTIS